MKTVDQAGHRAAGLAHGNRGREPVNKVRAEVAEAVVQLAQTEYKDYNDRHFTEELAERHAIVLSNPTVRRLRRQLPLADQQRLAAPERPLPDHLLQRPEYLVLLLRHDLYMEQQWLGRPHLPSGQLPLRRRAVVEPGDGDEQLFVLGV
jgi:hypothetical protein